MANKSNNQKNQLTDETIKYLESRPKAERSPIGQFITPKILRDRLASQIEFLPGMRVLDPGVGTAEFLKTCHEIEPDLELHGWDIDQKVLKVAEKIAPYSKLKLKSALEEKWNSDFDVVIGNPPYFEMRNLDPVLKNRYKSVIGGRPNIFSLFFAAGLGALKPGGQLGFVVPPSMNNGAFFENLRRYIASQGSIEFLELYNDHSLFLDAQTAVQLIVIRKGGKSENFTLDLGRVSKSNQKRLIFSENPKVIENEFLGKSTVWNLGFEAITGSVVWNKNKENLRVEKTDNSIPLLWAHNISESREIKLIEDKAKKPQYVEKQIPLNGPAIIMNRITGSVGNGSLRCALIPDGFTFVGENHVNIIRPRKGAEQLVSWSELFELLGKSGINDRIQKLTGNTQLSCVELTHWLPLDTDVAATEKIESNSLQLDL